MTELRLAFGLSFPDLYVREGLIKLDAAFIDELKKSDADLHNRLVTGRSNPEGIEDKAESQLLIDIAPHLEDFIGKLFGIEKEIKELQAKHHELANIYSCKRLFVQRRAAKAYNPEQAYAFNGAELRAELEKLFCEKLSEESYSNHVTKWMEANDEPKLDAAAKYACWALYTEEGKQHHKVGVLFKNPKKLDFVHLVPVETEIVKGVTVKKLNNSHFRYREGFALTDNGANLKQTLDEANYCIWCHNQGKDSCSKGLKEKDGAYKKSPHNVTLAGCPLEEKISEMNAVKSQGYSIGALAVITVDNPMCAGTGHRICNDCMKSCIYQKQDPVNIPQVETRSLKDTLELPWGFEIYSLLTRWNPLNLSRPIPKEESGYKVLVSGLGPAGFTLAHHLLNDGHTVVAIDGLKIEPMQEDISGVTPYGGKTKFKPVYKCDELFESLDERVTWGFGGVAEYGITIRWNKNYLKLIRLILERRRQFAMFGGVRFGGTITYESAFKLGFDHIALAMGAGKPTMVSMPNAVARGVRAASDFLMALQLTGAARKDSIANLQVRLPIVVIGGGLTAIDTATESLAYYPIQVEKFLSRYETLVKERGQEAVEAKWTEEDREIAEEFISHAKEIREEREKAKKENRDPNILSLINKWGGVKLAYRQRFIDSPSYRLNHEEVEKALEEGITFVENATPVGVRLDDYNHVRGLRIQVTNEMANGEIEVKEEVLKCKSIFIAAGTSPNTVVQREDPAHFQLDGKYFKAVDENGNQVKPEQVSKPKQPHVLMSINSGGKATSFFGDLHPSFAGNVVKAMGSAKQGYPIISRILVKSAPSDKSNSDAFIKRISELFVARVHEVIRLTPTIIEIVVKAPLAAREFQPGQFYRLQNFETFANKANDGRTITTLAMEGLALTGAWVDKEKGLISTIVLEMGGSSDLCAFLKKDEPVVLMGPTGAPTEIHPNEKVLLIGGGLGNAVLFSIGKAFKEKGSKVLYFAGYRKAIDRYKLKEIEEASDVVVWSCDDIKPKPTRPQDKSFHGNIVQAIEAYGKGELGDMPINLKEIDRIIAIGSDRMMAAVAKSRHGKLKPFLKPEHQAIGSINSPMQCMMKEICAQCLQKQVDPKTGARTYIFSCFNQDQCLDSVSFTHLHERLKQNSLQEKITAQWVDRSLKLLQMRTNVA